MQHWQPPQHPITGQRIEQIKQQRKQCAEFRCGSIASSLPGLRPLPPETGRAVAPTRRRSITSRATAWRPDGRAFLLESGTRFGNRAAACPPGEGWAKARQTFRHQTCRHETRRHQTRRLGYWTFSPCLRLSSLPSARALIPFFSCPRWRSFRCVGG